MNAVSGLLTPAATVLADGNSLDKTKPGLVAFLIILAMGLALWALLKNMGKQLGRAKAHFEAEDAGLAAQATGAAPAVGAAAAAAAAPTAVGTAEAVAEVPKQNGGGTREPKAEPAKDAAAE
jgi:hypothetical protein